MFSFKQLSGWQKAGIFAVIFSILGVLLWIGIDPIDDFEQLNP